MTATFFLRGNDKMYFAAEKCINTFCEVRSIQGGCISVVGAYNTIKHFVVFRDAGQGGENPQNFVFIILLSGAWSLICFPDV